MAEKRIQEVESRQIIYFFKKLKRFNADKSKEVFECRFYGKMLPNTKKLIKKMGFCVEYVKVSYKNNVSYWSVTLPNFEIDLGHLR